mmetsp:Transcript_26912/g.48937  ORF Transcript_26912/g.48937 Transcript_26912/m.48937 type:complete len:337 (-) Transcript_26912:285-1295(-)
MNTLHDRRRRSTMRLFPIALAVCALLFLRDGGVVLAFAPRNADNFAVRSRVTQGRCKEGFDMRPRVDCHNNMVNNMKQDANQVITVGEKVRRMTSSQRVQHFFGQLEDLYSQSGSIKCPFFRRRAADAIDSASEVLRFLLIRHKSLGIFDLPPPPGCNPNSRFIAKNPDGTPALKAKHLSIQEIATIIERDWVTLSSSNIMDGRKLHKGYYITGRLNSTIYRNDCLFDGPDPDMPVRGLRKYLSAAAHLFDSSKSFAELKSLEYEDDKTIVVRWKLGGVLMLPWRPIVKPWTGTTRYHLDEEGLIYLHDEEWDISAIQAFVYTLFPKIGERIYGAA